jgi:hypothetical protein
MRDCAPPHADETTKLHDQPRDVGQYREHLAAQCCQSERVADFAGRENRVIGGDHGCANVNHEPAVSPDGFMAASIKKHAFF